jgi:hypothetical protein
MIEWNMALTKPAVNTEDKFDAEQEISKRVVVRVVDRDGIFCSYSFARYYHKSEHWVIEGYLGSFGVTHWSSTNEPEN